jgi:hypothetical protein
MYQPLVAIFLNIALLIFAFFITRRCSGNLDRTIPILLIGLVSTSAIMVGGFTFYDESFAMGWVLASATFTNKISSKSDKISPTRIQTFCIFFLSSSVMGIFVRSEVLSISGVRQLRWVVYFVVLYLIFRTTNNVELDKVKPVSKPSRKSSSIIWGLGFAVLYLTVGIITRYASGSAANSQFAQTYLRVSGWTKIFGIFGNSAYVVVPVILLATIALRSTRSFSSRERHLGFILLMCLFAGQSINLSRYGTLSILILTFIYLIESLILNKMSRLVKMIVPGLLAVFLVFTSVSESNVVDAACQISIINVCWRTESAKYANMPKDATALGERGPTLSSGVKLATSKIVDRDFSSLTGSGFRAEHTDSLGKPIPMYGLTALLLDSGLIGTFLFALMSIGAVIKLFSIQRNKSILEIACLTLMTSSFLIVNSLDILLLFVLLGNSSLLLYLTDSLVSQSVKFEE